MIISFPLPNPLPKYITVTFIAHSELGYDLSRTHSASRMTLYTTALIILIFNLGIPPYEQNYNNVAYVMSCTQITHL